MGPPAPSGVPARSMACHSIEPGTYESCFFALGSANGEETSSACLAGGQPLLSQRVVGTANCRIEFPGELRTESLFGFMEICHARALWTCVLTQGMLSLAATVQARQWIQTYIQWFYRSFWGACMRCGQRMTPSADSAGDQGPRD